MAEAPVSKSVWRYAKASKAHVVVDAEEYYAKMREAMLAAEHRILLIGWDFDTRITLCRREPGHRAARGDPPDRLGDFIVWLARRKPGLEIRVLKWNFGALKMFLRGSMPFDLLRWWRTPGIDFKFDGAHPVGCSHHQKIVDALATRDPHRARDAMDAHMQQTLDDLKTFVLADRTA
mgnify:CR=1 FL=1